MNHRILLENDWTELPSDVLAEPLDLNKPEWLFDGTLNHTCWQMSNRSHTQDNLVEVLFSNNEATKLWSAATPDEGHCCTGITTDAFPTELLENRLGSDLLLQAQLAGVYRC